MCEPSNILYLKSALKLNEILYYRHIYFFPDGLVQY